MEKMIFSKLFIFSLFSLFIVAQALCLETLTEEYPCYSNSSSGFGGERPVTPGGWIHPIGTTHSCSDWFRGGNVAHVGPMRGEVVLVGTSWAELSGDTGSHPPPALV